MEMLESRRGVLQGEFNGDRNVGGGPTIGKEDLKGDRHVGRRVQKRCFRGDGNVGRSV